jgi:tripartite-type tricarboxylate transporter receptor subunit TctC
LNTPSLRFAAAGLAACIATVCSGAGHAQTYPVRAVRAISVSGPGGAGDAMQRLVLDRLGQALGQNAVIDYRPGANGILAAELASKATADGYTLFISNVGAIAVNAALYRKLPYDPQRDFTPLTLATTSPLFLIANLNVPANSVKELIALAKAKPDTLTIGYPGSGGMLAGYMFLQMAGVTILQVPYKTVPGAMTDLISGQIQLYFAATSNAVPQIKAGRIKAYGVTTEARAAILPDVPTLSEAGLAGFNSDFWFGFFVPAGTPPEIAARLNREIVSILKQPEMREKITALGDIVIASTPEAFADKIARDIARYRQVVQDAKIPLQD